ncbi:cell division protein ZapE [Amphritea sp. HPY]|uniref:cell division protein ZapE n=1 Tax=Amphritea sp. HPY TaxID=3421652 RepID=UPI003D7E2C7C
MQPSFQTIFQQTIASEGYQEDLAQQQLATELDRLFIHLQRPAFRKKHIQGLYIWGPVGRGKTFLMDLFFKHIPTHSGLRLHFHRFMEQVHQQLQEKQGHKDPLRIVAKELAQQYRVICFDEFYLNDIADAMILSGLLQELFQRGVILISTSNRPPKELYQDTIYRDRVTPIITKIEQEMIIRNLDGKQDFRLRKLDHRACFYENDVQSLRQHFDDISLSKHNSAPVTVKGREIPVIQKTEHCIWFRFSDLCEGPRSQLDYIELASRFNTIMLSDIPPLGGVVREQIKARGTEDGSIAVAAGARQVILARMDDPARRFISLIDELYDRCVNLFLSSAVPLDQLYMEGSLTFEFARTYSRLTEMQSAEYQSRQHLP